MDAAEVASNTAVEVLVSYSHKDEKPRQALETHLSLLRRQGFISVWHDRRISAGTEWKQQISDHFDAAALILLLVSPDFLASDYCYDIEMKRALERHDAGTARVVPVILRPVDWQEAPFGKLQALPKDAKPISTWANRDQAFKNVVEGIRRTVRELHASKPARVKAAVTETLQVKHRESEHPARPQLDPIGGLGTLLPSRKYASEQSSGSKKPKDQIRGDGRILNLRVSSLGQYDTTIEWGTSASMEVWISLFRGGSSTPEQTTHLTSVGLPGREQTVRFLNLEPGLSYRVVAECDADRQEIAFKTHEGWMR